MLFNSIAFLLAFLPVTWAGFALLHRWAGTAAVTGWLVAASYVFYGWVEPWLVVLLGASTVFNYGLGAAILRARGRERPGVATLLMWLGIAADLGLLGYFKYANFLLGALVDLTGARYAPLAIALPVGISFFTFTQIAYLVDAAQGRVGAGGLGQYALFVSYFPHLVAGPILHHRDMIPQFRGFGRTPLDPVAVACGTALFALGLGKKILIADNVAPFADAAFGAAGGQPIGLVAAWSGAVAYAFQIYFDFSGYSDMAMGLSLLFGVRLPLNFASPYKSASIIEFWNRWHISLSQFLRDYLYIPLGGNRRGLPRRYANLLITMLLGGLWHGADWTFVLWGALHGVYLAANHMIRRVRPPPAVEGIARGAAKRLIVFALVVIAWVPFRSDSMGVSLAMLAGMGGLNGIGAVPPLLPMLGWLGLCLVIVWAAPNSHELFTAHAPSLQPRPGLVRATPAALRWRPSHGWAAATACLIAAAILLMNRTSPFLYFRF